MDKPKPDFSMEDLVGRLREAIPDIDQDGATTAEIAKALSASHTYVLGKLRALKESGRLAVVRKTITKLDDTVSSVAAYKLMEGDDESEESSVSDLVFDAGDLAGDQSGSSSTDV